MPPNDFPELHWLEGRRAAERVLLLTIPVLRIVLLVLASFWVGLLFLPLSAPVLLILLWVLGGLWMGAVAVLVACYGQKISSKKLALRADRVLGLPDDLLALSEFPDSAADWQAAARERARQAVQQGRKSWPLRISWRHVGYVFVALTLTLVTAWKTWDMRRNQLQLEAVVAQARDERVRDAEEVIQDWEEFARTTDDPELQKLFSETADLREAVQNKDPMVAMMELNQMEAKMTALADALSAESMAPQAANIAEALEAFGGMGALSAAVRNQNFPAAEKEAQKLKEKLARGGSSELRRGAAVAEMLGTEATTAQGRGNQSLADVLSRLSRAASQNAKKNSVPNEDIPMGSLRDQLAREAACQSSGRSLATARRQLRSLRQAMRGEARESVPSLCQGGQGDQPGGRQAGTGSDGQPLGEETALADAGRTDAVTGRLGEGESEITTTASANGSATTARAATAAELVEYIGLSEQAVTDESLPLAHRRIIRSYFERIRPTTDSNSP